MLRRENSLVLSMAVLLFLACASGADAQGRRGQGQGGPGGPPQGGPGGPGGGFMGPGMGGMGGMGGFFGGGPMADLMLLGREDVQKELELVDEQLDQIDKLRQGNDMREMFSQVRDLPREEQAEKMRELMESFQAKMKKGLNDILLPHQSERLGQLSVQFQMRGGVGLTASEDLAKKLKIDEKQRETLRTRARELEQELRKKLVEDLLKELTPEQQAEYKKLVGEPFEFQQEERGRGFGGFGGFGPGGPGGPGAGGPGGGRRGGN